MRTTPLLEDGRPMSLAGALGRYMYRIDSERMSPFLTSHAKTLLIDAIACMLGGVSTEIVQIADRQAGSSHEQALRATSLSTAARLPWTSLSWPTARSEEHTSELKSLMRISYAVFCLKKKKNNTYVTK